MPKSSAADIQEILKARFEKNARRHKGIAWSDVEKRIAASKGFSARDLTKNASTVRIYIGRIRQGQG